jgi:hypothetical protein
LLHFFDKKSRPYPWLWLLGSVAWFQDEQGSSQCFEGENLTRGKRMGVILKKGRDGRPRRTWCGVYELKGRRYEVNLGIAIRGMPPETLRDLGDIVFERSRVKAQEKLNIIVDEAKTTKHAERILERLYEHKTGDAPPGVPLFELIRSMETDPAKSAA